MPTLCRDFLDSVRIEHRPPLRLISPRGAPAPTVIDREVLQLASRLGLPIPNINGELLLLKCCKELSMPEVGSSSGTSLVCDQCLMHVDGRIALMCPASE